MTGWTQFALAYAIFLLAHMIPARPALRRRLAGWLGERAYLAVYSLVSLLILAWLFAAAAGAPLLVLWHAPGWSYATLPLVMLAACLLVSFGAFARNPFSIAGRADGFDPERPGIVGLTRHPVLWAFALWAGFHVLVTGTLAHTLLFGGFAAFALAGMLALDRRAKRLAGDDWPHLSRRTSLLPLGALIRGNWRPGWRVDKMEMTSASVRLLAGLGLYALLAGLHAPVVGVNPFTRLTGLLP